ELRAEVLAVHFQGVEALEVGRRELSQLLVGPEHVRADPDELPLFGSIEELPERWLVSLREGDGEVAVEVPQLGHLGHDDDVRLLPNVDLGAWDEGEAVRPEHSPLHWVDVDQAL